MKFISTKKKTQQFISLNCFDKRLKLDFFLRKSLNLSIRIKGKKSERKWWRVDYKTWNRKIYIYKKIEKKSDEMELREEDELTFDKIRTLIESFEIGMEILILESELNPWERTEECEFLCVLIMAFSLLVVHYSRSFFFFNCG